jgi:hypothetical protein
MARVKATRQTLTLQSVPHVVGVGMPVYRSGGMKVAASLWRVNMWSMYGEYVYLEWRHGVCVPSGKGW